MRRSTLVSRDPTGANDLCTSSPATMTTADTFRSQFRQTLQTLNSGLYGQAAAARITCARSWS
jgi:hypothetical protein